VRNFKSSDHEAVTKNRQRVKKRRERDFLSIFFFYINTIIDANSNFISVAFDTSLYF